MDNRGPDPWAQGLNGLSIHNLSLSQEGEVVVEFDLPVEQTTACYHQQLRGMRTLDVYEDPELEAAAKHLYEIVRDRVSRPDPERLKVNCDHCATSACCRKYNVLVTEADLRRLAEPMGLSLAQVRERYANTAAVDWTHEFTAQLACDKDEAGEEKCVFLKQGPGGQYRCSVYEHRPRICREFDMDTCDDFVALESVKLLGVADLREADPGVAHRGMAEPGAAARCADRGIF